MVATWCRPSHDPMGVEPFGWNWFSEVPSRLGFTLWGCSRVTARQRVVCWLLMSISLHGIAIVSDYWYLASFQKSMFHHVSPFFCEGFPSPASLRIPGDDLALTTKVGCWHVWLCRRARTDHSRCRRKTTRLHLVVGPKYPKLWAKQFEVYSSRIGTGNRISFSFSWFVQLAFLFWASVQDGKVLGHIDFLENRPTWSQLLLVAGKCNSRAMQEALCHASPGWCRYSVVLGSWGWRNRR